MKLKNLALLPLIVVGLNATTATNENVTKVYIADFNRAPDAAGLKYWIDTKLELENISQSFFDQDETKKLYPTTLSKADFVNEIYKNAFNRNGDPDGITYWTNELIHGTISRGNMILAIITGAKDTPEHGKDKTTIDNKTKVGLHFVASGSDDVDAAISIMDGITDDSTTVENAKEKIDQDVADADSTVGQTYVLTSKKTNLKGEGIDNVIGTSGDDTIIGLLIPDKNNSTYNSYEGEIDGKIIYLRDSIDGKIGNDTFKLTINDDDDNTTTMIDPLGKIKNVENIILDSNSSIKISGYYWTGIDNYTFAEGNETNITNIRYEIKSINFISPVQNNIVNMSGAAAIKIGTSIAINSSKATADGNITVTVNKSDTNDNLTDNRIETYTVNAKGNKGTTTFNLNSTVLTNVVITGDSNVNLIATSEKLASVDASGLVKKSLNFTSQSKTAITIKGGSGVDTITIADGSAKNLIVGGAGLDNIDIVNANGVDTIEIDGKVDIVNIDDNKTVDIVSGFKAGTDKISIIGLPTGSAGNFIDGNGTVADNTEAVLIMANSVLSTGIVYANINTKLSGSSYLAYDITNDGKTDGMIKFTEDLNLTYTDIK